MKTIRSLGTLAAWGGLLLTFAAPVSVTAQTQTLHGHVPAIVKTLQPLGRLPETNHLNLAIGLPLRNRETLTNLLRELCDPASPNYRHYLTPAQFTEQFGPTEADYQAVIAFARANGRSVTATHPNRVLLDVSGSAADMERALHVTLQTYRHPTEDRTFYAPDREPTLDLDVPILHVSGLDNYALPRPRLKSVQRVSGANAAPQTGSGRAAVTWAWISGQLMFQTPHWTVRGRWSVCCNSTATRPVTSPITKTSVV
jgi:subtilase family serine protease